MRKNVQQNGLKKGGIADEIAQLKQRREDRKAKEEKKNMLSNQTPAERLKASDAQFEKMMKKKKEEIYNQKPQPYISSESSKIFVVVRKRPLSKKEQANSEIDCVSVINPRTYIHECKIQIDGITKYLEDHEFYFDNSFGDASTTKDVYDCTINPMIDLVLNQGIVTCFAYGQTGSGKTYTMKGIESFAIDALFNLSKRSFGDRFDFYISFFEIYGGRLYDLLNKRATLQVLDDKNGKVQIYGLVQVLTDSPEQMHAIIDEANSIRTTHNTVTNETSSRSHAICNISVKLKGEDEEYGKLSLVDLAGSERAQETQSNNRQRRAEGAEINKSLLALKECIRALDEKKNGNPDQHVPFRASKLTHVLRDSFVSKSDKSKIIMISCISPSYSSANHSINTLRYSDRLKEQTKRPGNRNNPQSNIINQARFAPSTNNTAPSSNAPPITNIPSNKDNNINSNNNNISNSSNSNSNNIYSKPTTSSNRAVFNKQQPTNKLHSKPLQQQQQQPQPQHQPDYSDRMDIDDVYESPQKKKADDWDYLRKTAAFRDGKMYSDEFVRYHQLTDQLVEDEDNIMNLHMEIIKDDAKLLTEEGDLLSNIKGFGENEDFKMDAYISGLERIINRKLLIYGNIKKKVELYKQHIKEEDELRKKLNPKLFSDDEL